MTPEPNPADVQITKEEWQAGEIARLERELAEEHESFGKEIDRCIKAESLLAAEHRCRDEKRVMSQVYRYQTNH